MEHQAADIGLVHDGYRLVSLSQGNAVSKNVQGQGITTHHIVEWTLSKVWGGNKSTRQITTKKRPFRKNKNAQKSSILREQLKKKLPCRNQGEIPWLKTNVLKKFQRNETADFPKGSSLPIAVNLVPSRTSKQKPPCRPCEAVCAQLTTRMASVPHQETETRCRGICARMSQ